MNKKMSKRQRDIKTKLMAAICMLLVSSIMMVSTTYAWFTLSTAPEVTGIQTAVGANGNLEMALMPLSGDVNDITSGTADSMATTAVNLANVTWGNLVDLKENTYYGLSDITLFPSALNLDANGNISVNPLAVPVYGSDGRVASLATNKTTTGVYTAGKFYEKATNGTEVYTEPMGVRAIGTISGMTEQQLDYRAALAAASTAASGAQKAASDALKAEGPNLAAIAIEHATSNSESYTQADVGSLLNMVNALAGTADTEGALTMIENAIRQYLLAARASQNPDYADKEEYILKTDLATLNTEGYVPDGMKTMVTALATSISNAATAQSNLQTLYTAAKASYTWDDIEPSLELLANPDEMLINGIDVNELNNYVLDEGGNKIQTGTKDDGTPIYQTNMDKLLSSALSQGLNLTMATGAGVYADIADFTGDFKATITIPQVSYGTLNVSNVPATMATASTIKPPYLNRAETYVRNDLGEPSGAGGEAMPISDYYGYIIDLAFRTNAADSYLKLQTDAVDRVYEGNTANDATMGGGATMSFKSDSANFLSNNVLDLMECIKIVFFDPTDNSILSYAMLDVANADTSATDGTIVAEILLCDVDNAGNATAKTGADAAKIVDLEQNKAQQVSVLVYLDGAKVTNADVAYDTASSMTGKMNLQFSSSADLKPMEYTDLRQGTGSTNNNTPAAPITLTATTDITDATVISAVYSSGKVVVGLSGVAEGTSVKVTVGTEELTTTTITQESVVVAVVEPASEVTSSTTVTVSAGN